jgi:hypothetical protein
MQQNSQNTQIDNAVINTSGQGYSAIVPTELIGWNWGAFSLTWLWGMSNRVWISLLALIPFPLISIAMMIILGIKGSEWAWQYKKWDSIEQFQKSQRKWKIWGIASLLAPVVLIIGITMIIIGLLGYYGYIKF